MEKIGFLAACRRYFGLKPNQTMTEFAAEIKALTEADREYFKALFPSVGYEIV